MIPGKIFTCAAAVVVLCWSLADATSCPDRSNTIHRSAESLQFDNKRFVSENTKSLKVVSLVACIQKCLAACLCYFVNHRILKDYQVECAMVKYPKCGVKTGVTVIDAVGWTASKLSEETKPLEGMKDCCPVKELESLTEKFCAESCPISGRVVVRFDKAKSESTYRWRCYKFATLTEDGYYYGDGASYCTRETDIKSIINTYPEITSTTYKLGAKGESCGAVCSSMGKICSPYLLTLNSVYHFHRFGAICKYNKDNKDCFSDKAHPIFYPSTGFCHGFINVPEQYDCATGAVPSGRRLCKCVDPLR